MYSRKISASNANRIPKTNACASMTCKNGGTCIEHILNTAYCLCNLPHYGEFCQFKDVCYDDPCGQYGVCRQTPNDSYFCEPKYNLTNNNLDYAKLHHCPVNYCNFNGDCVVNKNKTISNNKEPFKCICNSYKTGARCEIGIEKILSLTDVNIGSGVGFIYLLFFILLWLGLLCFFLFWLYFYFF